MQTAALVVMLAYGLVTIIGGVMGFRAGSLASLIAGSAAGLLLLVFTVLARYEYRWAYIGAVVVAVALVGRFGMAMMRSGDPDVSSIMGIVAPVMAVGGVLVILLAAVAYFSS